MDRPNHQDDERYPWWELTSDSVPQQGDFLQGFTLVYPTGLSCADDEPESIAAKEGTFDLIVMTQSCDIGQRKVDSILLCPWFDLEEFETAAGPQSKKEKRHLRKQLQTGNLPGYHLLNDADCAQVNVGIGVVDFKQVYTAPLIVIEQFIQTHATRLRLLPPYREHLSQGFARFFMRVGLPVGIPEDRLFP